MMFVELPDGRLINPDAIQDVKPNADLWRVTYVSGRTEDFGGDNAAAIRKGLAAPIVKRQKVSNAR